MLLMNLLRNFLWLDEVKSFVSEYNSSHFTDFVISNNNKKSLVFECKHGRDRKSTSTGKRPKQHYNFLGCKASVRLYKSKKEGSLKVTQVNLVHNHQTTEEIHHLQNASLNDDEKELVLTLKQANARPSQIKRVLCERQNKHITTQRLRNLISKFLREENSQNSSSLEEFLASVETIGGTVKWTYDCDNAVDAFFLCTAEMKKKFTESNPFSILMDTTFNIRKENIDS